MANDQSQRTRSARRIRIGSMDVGDSLPNGRTFIIAEAGVNHDGDETTALHMVDAAAESGVDAVKFQMFRAEALTTEGVSTATYQAKETDETSQRSMLARLELPTESFERIVARCAEQNILFLATPFSPNDVDRLIALGTSAIKIASTDIVDVALLERACRASIPMIVSTGAATSEEIAAAVAHINAWGAGDRLILLHCVSSYPTAIGDANLRCIHALRDRFNVPVGFSDHTTLTCTGALAVCAGACVLEKHFTLNRSAAGPDHAMSLEPDSLREYVETVRQAESAMGEGDIGVQQTEQEVRTLGRKSVVAARDIAAGEVVSVELLSFKRAGEGLPPTELDTLVGKRALHTIKVDTPLTCEMVK
jgi:sialic acid synthase SpsE